MPRTTNRPSSNPARSSMLVVCAVFTIFSISLLQNGNGLPAADSAAKKTGSQRRPVVARRPVTTRAVSSALVFEKDILPIFKARCVRCHSGKSRKGDLDLTSFANVMKGGESGTVVQSGKTNESRLYELIHDGTMPPDKKNKITKAEIATIRRWIAGGAKSVSLEPVARLSQHDIVPLMNLRCTVCHGLRVQQAGLDLRTKASMLRGGKNGSVIVPGHPQKSRILKRIHAEEMPP
ncbi:MAG: hypothetical protein IID45_13330, partial [Planctomycetes bacterium]|nr:hypothetical protein [Planctomycetota bacterium]